MISGIVSSLHALALKGSEPPFAIIQVVVMILFNALGIAAAREFHERPVAVRNPPARAA
ncbi:MAG: hypothetical protein ACLPHI_02500 [Terriglobales bacterium]